MAWSLEKRGPDLFCAANQSWAWLSDWKLSLASRAYINLQQNMLQNKQASKKAHTQEAWQGGPLRQVHEGHKQHKTKLDQRLI